MIVSQILRLMLLVSIILVIGYFIMLHILHHTPRFVDKKYLVDCKTSGKTHTIVITKDGFEPPTLITKVCDRIVFKNTDTVYHQPAFGEHEQHLIYPGFTERAIKPQKENQGILRAFGIYEIHDHLYEYIEGEIIVKQ